MQEISNWHRALDVQTDLYKFLSSKDGLVELAAFLYSVARRKELVHLDFKDIRDPFIRMAQNFVDALGSADCCFITSDMLNIAMDGAEDLPNDYALQETDLIVPNGFILFEENIAGIDIHDEPFIVSGFCWSIARHTDIGDVVQVMWITDETDDRDSYGHEHRESLKELGIIPSGHFVSHVESIRFGIPIEDMYPDYQTKMARGANGEMVHVSEEAANFSLMVIKLFYVINLLAHQYIGESVRYNPPREVRRRAARVWQAVRDTDINVITLRRKRTSKKETDGSREYTTRWIVKGHWRKQWYPSKDKHQWKYIHEYVKGPEGLPIKKGARRVFNFVR